MVLLFLFVAVIAPTSCVFWFMNDAARNETEAARLSLKEAYRSQMHLLRDSIELFWQKRSAELSDMPADFPDTVMRRLADSVVYIHAQSAPTGAGSSSDAPDRTSVAARVAQAEVRSLLATGQKAMALQAIQENFVSGPAVRGSDEQGRLIAADEQFLALQLMKPHDRRYILTVHRLAGWLNDYSTAIPPAQRLFLMDRLRTIAQVRFPTYDAERLRAQFMEAGDTAPADPVMLPSRLPAVWKLTTKTGNAIALYRAETILAAARTFFDQQNSSAVQFRIAPPGSSVAGDSLAAGPLLPGWQVSFSLPDSKALDTLARQRTLTYFWIGYLVIAAIALSGMMAGRWFGRQLKLAHLKTDLVAAVSHELKTPLASMRVLVDSLLDDSELEPQKTREYLQLIAGENTRLTRVIENFLAFSRIERNRHQFAFRETKPSDVVEAAVNAMRERLQAAECQLKVEVKPGLPSLQADEDALVMVLSNLLDNAIKYTRQQKRISIQAYCEAGHVVFAVEDNGVGIPAREHKRIFRRFYQVDRSLAREAGGCGLGLSIVDFIVRAHGGMVRVRSEAGAGSAFQVLLPCAS